MDAAEEKRMYLRRYESEREQMNSDRNAAIRCKQSADQKAADKRSYQAEKHNLEKRLEEVRRIVSKLDNEVSNRIVDANKAAAKAGDAYCSAIKCPELLSADVAAAFRLQSVGGNTYSNSAYQACKTEITRLEQGIESLKTAINNAQARIDQLQRQMRTLQASAEQHRRSANYYWYQADSIHP